MTDPAILQRHLAMLDSLADTGMVLVDRHCTGEPRPGQNQPRDFLELSASVRRSILFYHLLETDRLPTPAAPRAAEPEPKPEPAAPKAAPRPDDRTRLERLDTLDTLETVDAPFEHTVAKIVRDIQAVAKRNAAAMPSNPAPNPAPTTRPQPQPTKNPAPTIPRSAEVDRPEADNADLN